MPGIECRDFASRACEQLFKAAGADAEKRVVRETQFRFCDELEVHEFFERGKMRRADIGNGDLTGFYGFSQRRGFDRIAVEKTFDGPARFGIAGAAIVRFELEPIEDWRVMTGGNHHPADGMQIFNGERNRRRWRRLRRENDLKAVARENFRRCLGKFVREQPPVVTDDNFQFMPEDFGL